MADKKIKLLSLEMENFQSITKPVRLDFSPITLLYGPNSAGKSAVFDALELLKLIFNPQQTPADLVDEFVQKWTHKPANLKDEEHTVLKLAIEIKPEGFAHDSISESNFSTEALNRSYQALEYGELLSEIFGNQKIRYEYQARLVNSETFINTVRLDKVSISAILRYHEDENERQIKILDLISDFANENLEHGNKVADLDSFSPKLNIFLYLDEFSNNWAYNFDSISKSEFLESDKKESGIIVGKDFCYGSLSTYDSSIYHLINDNFSDSLKHFQFKEAYIDYVSYFGGLLNNLIEEAFPLVKADRSIPSPESTLVLNNGISLENVNDKGFHGKFDIRYSSIPKMLKDKFNNQEPFLKDLAFWSHFQKTYLALKETLYSDTLDPDLGMFQHIDPKSEELTQFRRVNKYLSDYLFLEKGYRIDSETEYLVSENLFYDVRHDLVARSPALTRVYLVDTAGRKLEIQDVGSGIAFVLPILVSISQHQISLIQQPELHLHPALQSSLAEVFIDRLNESNNDDFWQSIIETHSEHLLLRILRRIRETEQGRNSETNITADDVAVYYFNPLLEGGTELRKMLITPLGDFYNTWPRGFFDERNKDIFDE